MTKLCSIPGCGREHYARGWCNMHYNRSRSSGDPLGLHPKFIHGDKCGVFGCSRPYYARGVCHSHYISALKGGKLDSIHLLLSE